MSVREDSGSIAKGLTTLIPEVYTDVAQPAARELGLALQTVARTVHVALAPVSALVWGYDQIRQYTLTALSKRLADSPPDCVATPPPSIAGPALEALRFVGHDSELRELYANLLATSMDLRTTLDAHPAFVEILKQLSPDEARIATLFHDHRGFPSIRLVTVSETGALPYKRITLLSETAQCRYPRLEPTYLDNLQRLGLIRVEDNRPFAMISRYQEIESHATVQHELDWKDEKWKTEIWRGAVHVTDLGHQFYNACVASRSELARIEANYLSFVSEVLEGTGATHAFVPDAGWVVSLNGEIVVQAHTADELFNAVMEWVDSGRKEKL